MSIEINLTYPHLQYVADNKKVVKVNGRTIGECLNDLVEQFPGIKDKLFNEHNQLLSYVYIYVNEQAYIPTDLAMAVKDDDKLMVGLLLAGG